MWKLEALLFCNSCYFPSSSHCSGGSGRTGTFITIANLLDCLKSEGVVDVFQTVRTLRLQRPYMVRTVVSGYQSDSQWVAILSSHCFLSISLHPPTHRNSTVSVTPLYWSTWSPSISMPTSSEHDWFVMMF